MSVIAKWSGAGVADGTTLANTVGGTGDTKFDTVTVSGGSLTVKNGGPYSPRIEQVPAGAASNNYFLWQTVLGGSFPQHALRVYLELASLPAGNNGVLVSVRDASNVFVWWLDVSVAGILRLRNNGGTAVASTSQPLPLNTVLRIEVLYTALTDTSTVYIYRGDSQIPIETLSGVMTSTVTGVQVRFGTPNNAQLLPHVYYDEMAFANTADLIGPVVPGPSSPWSIWDGTTEKTLVEYGLWNGTSLNYYGDTPYLL